MPSDNLISLGHEYEPCCAPSGGESKEKRIDYPCIYYRGSEDIGPLPDDEFYFIGVGKKKNQGEGLDEKDQKTYTAEFEIRAIKVLGDVEDDDGEMLNEAESAASVIAKAGERMRSRRMEAETEED